MLRIQQLTGSLDKGALDGVVWPTEAEMTVEMHKMQKAMLKKNMKAHRDYLKLAGKRSKYSCSY